MVKFNQKPQRTKQSNSKHTKFSSEQSFYDEDDEFDSDDVVRKWYKDVPEDQKEFPELPADEVSKLKIEAQRLLENEILAYNNKSARSSNGSQHQWLKTIMAKGTSSDKIAAFTVVIQNSPVHSLSTIRNMVGMVKVSKKKECIMVIETLTELFLADLLPPDRKLRLFESRPLSLLGSEGNRASVLVRWYFEDQLKNLYQMFVQALQVAAQDAVDSNKEKAVAAMQRLLAGHPELEKVLLTNLVNKLGDPSQKVSSKVIYCLTQLLQEHPNMRVVVMGEIEKLLFRPNISSRAQYYGICFLTQLLLSREDSALAVNLIKVYFSFFKACLKKGDVDTRLMSALLTGVNRAYPYSQGEISQISEHIETMYKVVHIASFNISIHALSLLYQVAHHTNDVSDRFYSALYKKLLDPKLSTSSQHALLISLTFRALKRDVSESRVRAFIKRLLQICLYLPVPLVCAILYTISQLLHKNKSLRALEMKALVGGEGSPKEEDDEDGEHYVDVKLEEDECTDNTLEVAVNEPAHQETVEDVKPSEKHKPTWFHSRNLQESGMKARRKGYYDFQQRNPLFAGADFAAYSELLKLQCHYHPTVVLFANKILQGETISYSGDPLQDFTLAKFLERFVFKNPKKIEVSNKNQNAIFSRKRAYAPVGVKTLAVNSANYLNSDEANIPVEELFMFKYLSKKKETAVKKEDDGSDADSVASEEFEDMMDSLMGAKDTNIDFADEVGTKLASRKRKGTSDDSGDDDDDDEEEEEEEEVDQDAAEENESDLYDELNEFDDVEDLMFDDDNEDDEPIDFDINNLPDEDEDEITSKSKHKGKGKPLKKLMKKGGVDRSIFASADEFAEMLQDTGASGLKLGGSSALSNRDKAGEKQLRWEMSRDRWLSKGKGPPRGKRKSKGSTFSRANKRFRK